MDNKSFFDFNIITIIFQEIFYNPGKQIFYYYFYQNNNKNRVNLKCSQI